ncbi:hypothetical protein [Oceanobacillus profundus]|uniref:hypothetical protein n=1 Tax=Oceanobacillus profundus TaxID=372463 RepID=UPI00362BAE81
MNRNAPTKKMGDTPFLRHVVGVVFINYSRQQLILREAGSELTIYYFLPLGNP